MCLQVFAVQQHQHFIEQCPEDVAVFGTGVIDFAPDIHQQVVDPDIVRCDIDFGGNFSFAEER